MAQVKSGTVVLVAGSATVRGVNYTGTSEWKFTASASGVTGSFTPGDSLVGASSGAVLTYLILIGGVMRYRLISGQPISGEVFNGPSGSAALSNMMLVDFKVNEVVSFSPSGATGRVVAWSPQTLELRYERTSGMPAAGDDMDGALSAAQAKAVAPQASTAWLLGGPVDPPVAFGGAHASLFNRRGVATSYEVASVTAQDVLALTTPYAGASEDDVPYRVSQDFDAETGLVLLSNGDADAPALWNRNVARIKGLLGNAIGLFTTPPSFAGNAKRTTRVNAGESALELFTPAAPAEAQSWTALQSFGYNLLRLVRDAVDLNAGGRMKLEPGANFPGADLILMYDVRKLSVFVEGQPAGTGAMTWDPYTGLLSIGSLSLGQGFATHAQAGTGLEVRADHEARWAGRECLVSAGGFAAGEVLDFTTSGAVGRAYALLGGTTLVFHLVSGTPQSGESVVGRRSGAAATATTIVNSSISSVTATTLTLANSPAWAANQWAGHELEVLADVGAPAAVGQKVAVASNTASQLTVAAWAVQPSTQAVFRLYLPTESRALRPAPWGLAAPVVKADGDQAITAEAVVTQLSQAAAIPGANGARWFAIHGSASWADTSATANKGTLRLRVGPLGTIADPIAAQFEQSVVASGLGVLPYWHPHRLAPDDRITVTFQATTASSLKGGTVPGLTSRLDVVELKRR